MQDDKDRNGNGNNGGRKEPSFEPESESEEKQDFSDQEAAAGGPRTPSGGEAETPAGRENHEYAHRQAAREAAQRSAASESDDDSTGMGPGGARLALVGSMILAVGLFGGLVWYIFAQSGGEDGGDVPVAEAPDEPVRTEPEDPGGMDVPHQDRLVYDRVSGEERELEDNVTEAPEEPIDRETDSAGAESAEADTAPEQSGETVVREPEAQPDAADVDIEAELEPEDVADAPQPTGQRVDLSGNFRLQLGSFGSEARAEQGWDTLQSRYVEILGNLNYSIEAATLADGRQVFRLRTGPFADRNTASTACNDLQARGGDCLVVSPGG